MRVITLAAIMYAGIGSAHAGDLDIRVMLSGQVAPGVYGQVQFGSDRPPPVVYAQPMLIEPQVAPPPPVYLHVPPGHARNWRKHCHEYNACNRPCTSCDRRNTNRNTSATMQITNASAIRSAGGGKIT